MPIEPTPGPLPVRKSKKIKKRSSGLKEKQPGLPTESVHLEPSLATPHTAPTPTVPPANAPRTRKRTDRRAATVNDLRAYITIHEDKDFDRAGDFAGHCLVRPAACTHRPSSTLEPNSTSSRLHSVARSTR